MTDEKQNEVSESKEIPHEINSISDLSKILQTLGEPEKGHTRFFRGHGDKGWQMLPSIYRAKHLIENEDKIIKSSSKRKANPPSGKNSNPSASANAPSSPNWKRKRRKSWTRTNPDNPHLPSIK